MAMGGNGGPFGINKFLLGRCLMVPASAGAVLTSMEA